MISRRNFFKAALAAPAGAALSHYEALAAPARDQVKITRIQAMQVKGQGGALVKIDTDAGLTGYGESGASGPQARDVIAACQAFLVGQDPLAIRVHFHNLAYRLPQRPRAVRVWSGIDIALWDLAGKILGQPVSKLLGGNFREEIPLYSHCSGGDYFSKEAWRDRVQELLQHPAGFKAFKVDIHHPLGVRMGEFIPSIGPQEARKIRQAYALAREAFGPGIDIIVHCHNELDLPSAIKAAEAVEPIKPLFFEDPIAPPFSDSWLALRRTTRLPLMTGEALELPEQFRPFIQSQAVDVLQPDLAHAGGITATRIVADLAALYRIPVCLHNVGGLILQMASQQWSAAVFNCPMMECRRDSGQAKLAASNAPVIKDGRMKVSTLPGLGLDLNPDYLKSMRVDGEPMWQMP